MWDGSHKACTPRRSGRDSRLCEGQEGEPSLLTILVGVVQNALITLVNVLGLSFVLAVVATVAGVSVAVLSF